MANAERGKQGSGGKRKVIQVRNLQPLQAKPQVHGDAGQTPCVHMAKGSTLVSSGVSPRNGRSRTTLSHWSKGTHDFLSIFHSEPMTCLASNPFHTLRSAPEWNGLEALRLLMDMYEPCTALTKRAHLKAIICRPSEFKIWRQMCSR